MGFFIHDKAGQVFIRDQISFGGKEGRVLAS